jgi:signal transduction histidine kinase
MTPLALLVTCKPSGRLVRVMQDAASVLRDDATSSLLYAIDAADVDAFKRFMQTLYECGHAFGANLRVRTPQGVSSMRFAGVAGGPLLWVAAAQDPAVVLDLLAQAEREIEHSDSRAQSRGNILVLLDELTAVNNELVNLQRELAQRNAALVALTVERNQLLGIAAHDLRNPIMVVQSYCELLLSSKDAPLEPKQVLFVERVNEATDAMLLLLKDTLDYSRLASADLKLDTVPTDLTMLVAKNVLDYLPMAERKHIALSFHPPERPLPKVLLDVAKIERVLVNLLSNAIKYSREGCAVEVYVTRSLDVARVSVLDRGDGIAADDVALLFRPFQTGSNRPTAGESSTGLGLAIVKKLVESHGGHVAVSARPQGGTSFSFELPFEPPAHLRDSHVLTANDAGRHPHANDSTQHS